MNYQKLGDKIYSQLCIEDDKLRNSFTICKDVDGIKRILDEVENNLNIEIANLEKQVDDHVLLDQLHRFNDTKDSAQAVIGTLANHLGVTVASLHEDFNADCQS